MSQRNEERHWARASLSLSNALRACRVIRGDRDVFGENPFAAVAAGGLLSAALSQMVEGLSETPNWASRVFPTLSPVYGPLIAHDMSLWFQMALSERNRDSTERSIARLDRWGTLVARGDTDAEYLADVASEIGKELLTVFCKDFGQVTLPREGVNRRAEELFELAFSIGGGSIEDAMERDRLGLRKQAYAEVIAASAATHLYLCEKLDFRSIDSNRQLGIRISPTRFSGCVLQTLLEEDRPTFRVAGPVVTLSAAKAGWGDSIGEAMISIFKKIEQECSASERILEQRRNAVAA